MGAAAQDLFGAESEQQNIVNWTMLLADIGLAAVLVALAVFMLWRLYDLLQAKGYWARELAAEKKQTTEAEIEEQKRKLEELTAALKEVSI
jgi:large-conductance mechanosensitive channel